MKKWIIFATLSAIAGAASAVLPYMSDLATTGFQPGSSSDSQSTAGMMLAALGIMAVIVVRRSGK